MVDVNTQNKTISVNVSSSGVSSNVNASGDTTMYYSNKAKEWAISNRIVDGIDYSSKYYAEKSNQSALNAQSFAQSAQDSYNNFQDSVTDSLNTIDNKVQEANDNIEIQKQDTITEIQDIATNQKEEIENLSEQEQNKIVDLGIDTRANVDLSNLSANGEKHFLNKSQLTNCLLEVPQNIKLELADGTLTLKAGSKVIVPYGTEDKTADFPIGTVFYTSCDGRVCDRQYANGLFFLTIEIGQDLNTTDANTSEQVYAVTHDNGGTLFTRVIDKCVSGAGATTTFGYAYDITANKISWYAANGGLVSEYVSFPICKASANLTSIDQVFNGMGYIGSTIWLDKGIKGLIPNGRNADGTLNNIEFETPKVIVSTLTGENRDLVGIVRNSSTNYSLYRGKSSNYAYNEEKNINIDTANNTQWNILPIGYTTGDITSFQPKLPFRAVDYNDFVTTPHIVETYKNGTSWYRVWSDGWKEQGGLATAHESDKRYTTVTFLKAFSNTNYTVVCSGLQAAMSNSDYGHVYSRTATSVRFNSAQSDADIYWYACGY